MRRIFRLLCLALLCAVAVPAQAADIPVVLKKVQEVYAGMKDFRANFEQKLFQRDSGTEEVRTGVLLFQKPLLVRWDTRAPRPELLAVTEREIWNYLPDEELAYRYPRAMAEDSRSLVQVVTGQSALDRDFDVESAQEESAQGESGELIHLLLNPKEPTTELTEVQIWVDPSSFLIRKVSIMDFYGNTNTVELKNLKPNAGLQASDFQFTPPQGTEVEDHVERPHPVKRPLFN